MNKGINQNIIIINYRKVEWQNETECVKTITFWIITHNVVIKWTPASTRGHFNIVYRNLDLEISIAKVVKSLFAFILALLKYGKYKGFCFSNEGIITFQVHNLWLIETYSPFWKRNCSECPYTLILKDNITWQVNNKSVL